MRFHALISGWLLVLAALLGGCSSYAYRMPGAAPMEPSTAANGEAFHEPGAQRPTVSFGAMAPDPGDELARLEESSDTGEAPSGSAGAPNDPPPPPVIDAASQHSPPESEVTYGSMAKKRAAPLLIYSARIHMAVFEVTKSIDAVQKVATEMGGYLVMRNDNTIKVRVPTDKFRAALASINKHGDVLHREESVKDVTDEYFDLQARLRNAQAMRERLVKLLEQAQHVKEAILVEKELGRVTEQIERMQGRLKLLGELVRFSTITVQYEPRATEHVGSKVNLPFPWLDRLGLSHLLAL